MGEGEERDKRGGGGMKEQGEKGEGVVKQEK